MKGKENSEANNIPVQELHGLQGSLGLIFMPTDLSLVIMVSTAKKFGVTEFVNPKDYKKLVQEMIADMTNGGVDRSVECTGHIDAMISAFLHDGWGVGVLVGVPHKDAVFKTSPLNILNERTLKKVHQWLFLVLELWDLLLLKVQELHGLEGSLGLI